MEFREDSAGLLCSLCCPPGHSASVSWWLAGLENPKGLHTAPPYGLALPGWLTSASPISVSGSQSLRTVAGFLEGESRTCQFSDSLGVQVPEHHFCHILLAKESHKASPDSSGEVGSTSGRVEQHVPTEREGITQWPSLNTDWILFAQLLILMLILTSL